MVYDLQEWEKEGKPMNKIICCDCLEGLKKIPDNSINLVLTDQIGRASCRERV